jgi:hypothetical protein
MKAYHCDQCGNLVFFENVQCVNCKATLGYLPDLADLSALERVEESLWRAKVPAAQGRAYRACQNQVQHQVCNWLVPAEDPTELCQACRLNQTIPDLSVPGNIQRWHKLETAKRRLLYAVMHLGLQTDGIQDQNKPSLRFSFVADPAVGPRILTGHKQGLITINIAEADDAVREQNRVSLHEPYRTLLGHFRHEVAHFFWERLIADTPRLDRFRELFGDHSCDYAAALETYYKNGPPPDWQLHHVSAYATSHPWEDWAETWAHYLHIQDTVETAASFGMNLTPRHPNAAAMTAFPAAVKEDEISFDRILHHWLPVTYAVNELNRGMGLPDVYPFILSDFSLDKLRFVHQVVLDSHA